VDDPQNRDLKPITVYLPEELIVRLKAQAAVTRDSISGVVRRELMRPRVEGRDQSARADSPRA
jgi:hypothetical protein